MQSLQSRLLNSTNSHALLLLLSCPMCSDGIPLKFDSAITILVADASKAVLMLGMCIAVPLCPHHTPTAVSLTLPPRVGNTIAGGGATFNLNRFHDTIIQKAQLSLVRRHIHLPSRCTSNCVCRRSPSSPSLQQSIVIGNSRFHHGFQASTMTTVDHAPDGVHGKDGAGAGAGAGAGIDAGAEDMGGFRHAIHDKCVPQTRLFDCFASTLTKCPRSIPLPPGSWLASAAR